MMLEAIQNNNPGNIRNVNSYSWVGEIGTDYRGFVIFDNLVNGTRAMIKLLRNYGSLYGDNTIEKIVNRYAPAGAPDYNNPVLYIQQVSSWSGIPKNKVIDWLNFNEVSRLISAMVKKETSDTIPPDILYAAYQLAIPGGGVITSTPGSGSPQTASFGILPLILLAGVGLAILKPGKSG